MVVGSNQCSVPSSGVESRVRCSRLFIWDTRQAEHMTLLVSGDNNSQIRTRIEVAQNLFSPI